MTQPPARFPDSLRRWYFTNRRDLPFRKTRDPYAIWLSEVILQQTTVAVGASRWSRFLERFPSVEALAAASETEVLAEWAGLGYYARARNLSRAARAIVRLGDFPRSSKGLAGLPGIGPYTAAAIASIAFGERVSVLDGNVARVLSRFLALSGDPKSGAGRARLRREAEALLPKSHPGDHNQALMELGATVCTPRNPRCAACPLRRACRAHAAGQEASFPATVPGKAAEHLTVALGAAVREGRLLLVPDAEMVRGHLLLPLVRVGASQEPGEALRAAWPALSGRSSGALAELGTLRHSVLQRRYRVHVFLVGERGPARNAETRVLVAPDGLAEVPHGGLLRKILARFGERIFGPPEGRIWQKRSSP
ncbi:MAG: A/G-specific adenine glycosylase [Acidobacteria bacterium]|nr:A/G-specific adenine glycosylase [Acidobacteriota bacterium]